ncbi:hypothetical protein PHMEG_00033985 [Phytophthora megakarya]|uniref:Peptidase A2 domain-containing protein n=1 Tax=Phytophthora megakarya TaxID=4795 RepID=A0A225USB8_9STRA|nr:hypothetical protein PHMEG_00033985 [Phytophthora megakarya]
MDLLPGESRGYWKHHSPGKWIRQAKITGKLHNEKAILYLDTGAELSIVDTTFAREVGCSSQIQDCVGIGDNVYRTEGRTRIKVTLAGSLVYFFDIWVGDLTGQQAILGMDFMVPAGIRLDLAHGSISLSNEVRIQLSGRRQLYSDKAKIVSVGQYLRIQAGESVELPLRSRSSFHDKLWVTRGDRWIPTISDGPGRTKYISITNIGDEVLILHQDQRIGIWLAGDHVPRTPGFISIGSRRYMEWQNLALETTTDARSEDMEIKIPLTPAEERSEYKTPRAILQRPKTTSIQSQRVEATQDQDIPDCPPSDKSPSEMRPLDLASVASEESDLSSIADEDSISHVVRFKEAMEDPDQISPDVWMTDPPLEETTSAVEAREEEGRDGIGVANQDQLHLRCQDQGTSPSKYGGSDPSSMMSVQSGAGHVDSDPLNGKCVASMSQKRTWIHHLLLKINLTRRIWISPGAQIKIMMNVYTTTKAVIYVDGQIAVLPAVPVTTEDVKIDDIQLCGSDGQTPEEID